MALDKYSQHFFKVIISLAIIYTLSHFWVTQAAARGDLQARTMMHAGVKRKFSLHYPNNISSTTPRPLVIVLHGGGGASAAIMARRTGLNTIADREGFIAVYPSGQKGQWNDGRGDSFLRGKKINDSDDVGFISALIDGFVQRGEADAKRIYVTGISNGGMMAYRLGIELGTKVAAIATIVANLPVNLSSRKPVRALPVLIMNGTEDPIIPWRGGELRALGMSYGKVLSTENTVKYWVEAARLPTKADKQMVADKSPKDKCRVEVASYKSEGRGMAVVLYAVIGGGHNLPGGNTPDRPRMLGRKCMDINGPEIVWSFFKKHSLDTKRDAGNHLKASDLIHD